MTLYELRLVAVLGLVAIGVIAILGSLAVVHLQALAGRLRSGIARTRTLPSLRGDARDAGRLIDHRQAAGRLRC